MNLREEEVRTYTDTYSLPIEVARCSIRDGTNEILLLDPPPLPSPSCFHGAAITPVSRNVRRRRRCTSRRTNDDDDEDDDASIGSDRGEDLAEDLRRFIADKTRSERVYLHLQPTIASRDVDAVVGFFAPYLLSSADATCLFTRVVLGHLSWEDKVFVYHTPRAESPRSQ